MGMFKDKFSELSRMWTFIKKINIRDQNKLNIFGIKNVRNGSETKIHWDQKNTLQTLYG